MSALFAHFATACNLPLIELDEQQQILCWNPAAERLFGYPAHEVLGRRPQDFLFSGSRFASSVLLWQDGPEQAESVQGLPSTVQCKTRQGRSLVCEWRYTPIHLDASGTPVTPRMVALVQDLTDRELATERIAQLISEQEALLDNTVFGAAFIANDRLMRCNETFAVLCGYQIHEVIQQPFSHFLPDPDFYANFLQTLQITIQQQGHWDTEIQLKRKYGSVFWASVRISPLTSPMPSSSSTSSPRQAFVVVMQDITARRTQQQHINQLVTELQTERERAMVTLEAIADAVVRIDTSGQIEYANPIALSLLGVQERALLGQPLAESIRLYEPETITQIDLHQLIQEHQETTDQIALWQDGEGLERAFEYSLSLLNGATGADDFSGAVLIFRDVTEQRRLSDELSWQARHDTLTHLPNRRSFEMRVDLALEGVRRLKQNHVVLFLDLDRFKIVNDTCGHAAGDDLLKQLSQVMLTKVRKSDMLARMGGDEFAVLLDSCTLEQALKVAEAIRQVIQDFRFVYQDKVFRVGVSIGAVPLEHAEQTLGDVLSNADFACYEAKEMGRNRVNLYINGDDTPANGKKQMEWLPRIHAALEQNRFELDLQMIAPTSLEANHLDSPHYEVLVRMIDETGQRVPPMSFIPVAERYGIMSQIDRWVATRVMRHCELLLRRPEQFNGLLCVNLSGESIMDESLLRFIRERLQDNPLLAQHLCFEVTETAAVSNLNRAALLMSEIKELGASFALDDFGSGMSSFAYLRSLPVDFLKIDGTFIKNLADDPINCAMVSGIHHVGQTMGLKTIAEFVESEAIVQKLREIGVDYAQGYAVHRPQKFELVTARWGQRAA